MRYRLTSNLTTNAGKTQLSNEDSQANLPEEKLVYFSRWLLIENDALNWRALSLVISRN